MNYNSFEKNSHLGLMGKDMYIYLDRANLILNVKKEINSILDIFFRKNK